MSDLRHEQALFEGLGYHCRRLLLHGIPSGDEDIGVKVDKALFGEVYKESRLVTFALNLRFMACPLEASQLAPTIFAKIARISLRLPSDQNLQRKQVKPFRKSSRRP